jgi:hypothetical protein
MSDTSQCHVNNTEENKQDDMKKPDSVVSTATSLIIKSPSPEGSALSDTKNDPGSPVTYQLVEQVCFTVPYSEYQVEGMDLRTGDLSFSWHWQL